MVEDNPLDIEVFSFGGIKDGIGIKVVMHLCFMFLKVSRQIFSLDTFGRQADEYITRGVMFFMYLCTGFSQNVLAVQKWIHSGYIYY
jgi:hypothetical protein